MARSNGGTSTLFVQGNGGGLTVNANVTLFKNVADATNSFKIQNAAGTTDVFDVDTQNARIGIGTAAPLAGLEVSRSLQNSALGFNFNILSTDTAAAAQNVGGGIGFAGNADSSRVFSAIQGFHESATASDYAGGLRFLTRPSGSTPLVEQARIGSTGQTTFKNSGDSTAAFQIQNSASATLFVADTSNLRIQIGSATADSTGVLLVLDTKNTSGDPTGVDGGMYYNSNAKTMRCREDGVWKNCIGGNSIWRVQRADDAVLATMTSSETAIHTVTVSGLEASHTYNIRVRACGFSNTGGDLFYMRLRKTSISGTVLDEDNTQTQTVANVDTHCFLISYDYTTGAAETSVTFVVTGHRLTGSGTVTFKAFAIEPYSFRVTDVYGGTLDAF